MEKRDETVSVKGMIGRGCRENTPFGDLCRDISTDMKFPWNKSHGNQVKYLNSKVAANPENEGLADAVREAIEYLNHRIS